MSSFFEHHKDFRDEQLPKWEKFLLSLWDDEIPKRKEITRKSEIIKVLKKIGKSKALNHTYMPDSGGFDLVGCDESNEKGCIEINFDGIPIIVKPNKIIFQSFPNVSTEWAYFYLITDNLKPSGVYEDLPGMICEELTEIIPGEYIDRSYYEYDEYNGKPLPESARVVLRYLKGSFVIFSKASIYNLADILDAYSAPHQKLGEDLFRNSIDKVSIKLKEEGLE